MTDTPLTEDLRKLVDDPVFRKFEFFRYYSRKRISHQLKQLELLSDVTGNKIAEIGSYLGFATALFLAAGFKVRTIDAGPPQLLGEITPERHIFKEIQDVTEEDLAGQDIIVCCETLEHLHFPDVERMLGIFHASSAPWLLLSVPYRCLSVDIRMVKNPFSAAFNWIVKFPDRSLKTFEPDPHPNSHKWELGYKGYPLEKMANTLSDTGYKVHKIDYAGTVQSVFFLCQRL